MSARVALYALRACPLRRRGDAIELLWSPKDKVSRLTFPPASTVSLETGVATSSETPEDLLLLVSSHPDLKSHGIIVHSDGELLTPTPPREIRVMVRNIARWEVSIQPQDPLALLYLVRPIRCMQMLSTSIILEEER